MNYDVLIIGAGRFGLYTAVKLHDLGHQVLAVDKNEERIDRILPYTANAQIGDSTDRKFMETIGVRDYDLCIVAIGDDFLSSLETTFLLDELGAQKIISRATTGSQEKFLLRNGADEVINPEKQIAEWAAIRYASDHIRDYIKLDDSHAIFEVTVPDGWVGRTIGNIDIRKKYGISILAIKRDGKMSMIITPDTQLDSDMTMLVLGDQKAIQKCFKI